MSTTDGSDRVKLNGRYRVRSSADTYYTGQAVTVVTLPDHDNDVRVRPDSDPTLSEWVNVQDLEPIPPHAIELPSSTAELRKQIEELQAELARRTEPLIVAKLSPVDYLRIAAEYDNGLLEVATVAEDDLTLVSKLTRDETVALVRHLISVSSITPEELQ